jgi:hypothetical protein
MNRGERGGFPIYWDHAEQFLDFVDTAARGNAHRSAILTGMLDSETLDVFQKNCVRVIAGECEFTSLVDLSVAADATPEAWQPYQRWVRAVKGGDSVITFNYDTVLEKLGETRGVTHLGKESVVGLDTFCGHGVGVTPIYKMHGSIDWIAPKTPKAVLARGEVPTLLGDGSGPLIAMPGPSKKIHCSGVFSKIWDEALNALTHAAVVVFVGYRFPPSDAESRTRLLAALRDNQSRALRVHTVLGPYTNEGDTIRLRELLRSTLSEKHVEQADAREVPKSGHFQVIVHPLYAEDFFTVFHENMLFGHSVD